jgi:hypothetical protein
MNKSNGARLGVAATVLAGSLLALAFGAERLGVWVVILVTASAVQLFRQKPAGPGSRISVASQAKRRPPSSGDSQ